MIMIFVWHLVLLQIALGKYTLYEIVAYKKRISMSTLLFIESQGHITGKEKEDM